MILLSFVVAVGAGFAFIYLNTPDPAAVAEVGRSRGASTSLATPAGESSPGTTSSASPTATDGCSDEPTASGELEPAAGSEAEVLSAAVTADYRFQDSFASTVGPAPDLAVIGRGSSGFAQEVVSGHTRAVLRFGGGRGLSLAPTTGVVDGRAFTIELLFRFCRIDGFRKIIDFEDASNDSGLYTLDGRLNFFPRRPPSLAPIAVDAYVHVVLTRDASARVVGYVDGVRQFSFHDADELAVIGADDTLLFFRDDSTTDEEYSGGAVARIRLYDGALTWNEVAGLTCIELRGGLCG